MNSTKSLSTELLIIGGGITGLGIAWDACTRGLDVILVEASHLGSGTTSRFHGLLHSGARYATHDPQTANDCAAENKTLREIAPFAVDDSGGYFTQLEIDPPDYPADWLEACLSCQVEVEECDPQILLSQEPLLTPKITRAFRVKDASIDSFLLISALEQSIIEAGGIIWKKASVIGLQENSQRVSIATIKLHETDAELQIHAEVIINASGPWVAETCALVDIDLKLELSRGAMFASGNRLVNSVINRCRPASDGDILVPVGNISIFGTTDVPATNPSDLEIRAWEIDLLYEQARTLIPDLASHRLLRAWAGLRSIYSPTQLTSPEQRESPRSHWLIDHENEHGRAGFLSITGGKLSTYRLMAEQAVDLTCEKLNKKIECQTSSIPLLASKTKLRKKDESFTTYLPANPESDPIICECENVTKGDLEQAIRDQNIQELDELRKLLKLGHGPCQAAYCAYRSLTLFSDPNTDLQTQFLEFSLHRWRGLRPVAWGYTLRQMELYRRIVFDHIGIEGEEER